MTSAAKSPLPEREHLLSRVNYWREESRRNHEEVERLEKKIAGYKEKARKLGIIL